MGTLRYDFATGTHRLTQVEATEQQAALATLRRIGAKLRQHAESSERSRHFTELFVKMDQTRSGTLTADEVALGMAQLGIDLKPSELAQLFDLVDIERTGSISIADFMLVVQRGTGVDAAETEKEKAEEAEAEKQAAAAMPAKVFEVAPQLNPCAPPPFANSRGLRGCRDGTLSTLCDVLPQRGFQDADQGEQRCARGGGEDREGARRPQDQAAQGLQAAGQGQGRHNLCRGSTKGARVLSLYSLASTNISCCYNNVMPWCRAGPG